MRSSGHSAEPTEAPARDRERFDPEAWVGGWHQRLARHSTLMRLGSADRIQFPDRVLAPPVQLLVVIPARIPTAREALGWDSGLDAIPAQLNPGIIVVNLVRHDRRAACATLGKR